MRKPSSGSDRRRRQNRWPYTPNHPAPPPRADRRQHPQPFGGRLRHERHVDLARRVVSASHRGGVSRALARPVHHRRRRRRRRRAARPRPSRGSRLGRFADTFVSRLLVALVGCGVAGSSRSSSSSTITIITIISSSIVCARVVSIRRGGRLRYRSRRRRRRHIGTPRCRRAHCHRWLLGGRRAAAAALVARRLCSIEREYHLAREQQDDGRQRDHSDEQPEAERRRARRAPLTARPPLGQADAARRARRAAPRHAACPTQLETCNRSCSAAVSLW